MFGGAVRSFDCCRVSCTSLTSSLLRLHVFTYAIPPQQHTNRIDMFTLSGTNRGAPK